MEAIAFVLGLAVVGALALRFGQDSREGVRCKEQELAARGMTWAGLAPGGGAGAPAPPGPRPPYPTLAFIEQALGAAGALTTSSDASRLEDRARVLTADCWSDAVWTTGVVPAAAFRQVLAELAPALLDVPARTVERPIAAAEPVAPARSAIAIDRGSEAPERPVGHSLAGSTATA